MSSPLTIARAKKDSKQFAEAIALLETYIPTLPPASPALLEATFELASCFALSGNVKAAIKHLIEMLQIQPDNYVILNELGVYFNNLGQYKMCVHYFRKSIDSLRSLLYLPAKQRQESLYAAFNNIGYCHVRLKDYDSAIQAYLEASLLRPEATQTLVSIADLHYYRKDHDKCLAVFRRHPELLDNPDVRYKQSFALLASRRFREGFEAYECRLHNNICPILNMPARVNVPFLPFWMGPTDTNCKRLLVVYEQGIGDNIQYFRFLLQLAHQCPSLEIAYFCKPLVQHLFSFPDHPNVRIVQEVQPAAHDAKVYIMSLPYHLQLQDVVPFSEPSYLARNPEIDLRWSTFLCGQKRVGFAVQGLLVQSFIDKTLPFSAVKQQLFDRFSDIQFISLQLPETGDTMQSGSSAGNVHIIPTLDSEGPFTDTVSMLHQVDLVITVDTSIAHLAGVARIPSLLLLGQGSDWRWFDDVGPWCSWYENMHILRAPQQDFCSILPQVASYLSSYYQDK